MATINSAKAQLIDTISALVPTASAKDMIFLAKSLKEATALYGLNWQGDYTVGTTYQKDDLLSFEKQTFVCTVNDTLAGDVFDTTKFDLVARAGIDGTDVGFGNPLEGLLTNEAGDGVEWGDVSAIEIITQDPAITEARRVGKMVLSTDSGQLYMSVLEDNTGGDGNEYMELSTGRVIAKPLQQEWLTAGAHTFTVPAGVTTVSAVVVGSGSNGHQDWSYPCGGGAALAWKADIPVTPGEVINLHVGKVNTGSTGTSAQDASMVGEQSWFKSESTVQADGGFYYTTTRNSFVGDGGGSGGYSSSYSHGGGGAGGYSGEGGQLNNVTPLGGGGGSGSYYSSTYGMSGGGGTGLLGEGDSGERSCMYWGSDHPSAYNPETSVASNAGYYTGLGGEGGSGGGHGMQGQNGKGYTVTANMQGSGGFPGGGAGGSGTSYGGGYGGGGAVRVVWGEGRKYPLPADVVTIGGL